VRVASHVSFSHICVTYEEVGACTCVCVYIHLHLHTCTHTHTHSDVAIQRQVSILVGSGFRVRD